MISRRLLTFFTDLSPYQKENGLIISEVLNIGWLSSEYPFTIGEASLEFTDKLAKIINNAVFRETEARVVMGEWRSLSCCPLCGISSLDINTKVSRIGSAEVWIPCVKKEEVYYSSSTWIYHYIIDHQYFPPEEYIESVLSFDENQKIYADIIAFDLFTKHESLVSGRKINRE